MVRITILEHTELRDHRTEINRKRDLKFSCGTYKPAEWRIGIFTGKLPSLSKCQTSESLKVGQRGDLTSQTPEILKT